VTCAHVVGDFTEPHPSHRLLFFHHAHDQRIRLIVIELQLSTICRDQRPDRSIFQPLAHGHDITRFETERIGKRSYALDRCLIALAKLTRNEIAIAALLRNVSRSGVPVCSR